MSPRMIPDGKVTAMNIGTPQDPNIIVASVGTALEDMAQAFKELSNVTDEDFLRAWAELADSYTGTPQDELRFRVQAAVNGDDPGEPVNRGADGWRVY